MLGYGEGTLRSHTTESGMQIEDTASPWLVASAEINERAKLSKVAE